MKTLTLQELSDKAYALRKKTLEVCIRAKTGHVTSSMSCIDILIALYHGGIMRVDPQNPQWEERDRLILSKGQGSPALYTILADLGFYPAERLDHFAQKGGAFGVHLQMDVPGVELTCGSLGQGFGTGAGIALAAKMDRKNFLTYVILGDGELYEGSVWETAMFAAHNDLNNLVAIVDRNYLCVTDFTENLIALEPLEEKWRSFGWEALRLDGHDYGQLLSALQRLRSRPFSRPTVIIADTTKGEGVEPLCHQPLWHGLAPQGETATRCLRALDNKYKGSCHE